MNQFFTVKNKTLPLQGELEGAFVYEQKRKGFGGNERRN
jgi:hypothetical protein